MIEKDCDNKVVIQMRSLGIISGLFYKKILHAQNANKRLSFRCFYTHRKH